MQPNWWSTLFTKAFGPAHVSRSSYTCDHCPVFHSLTPSCISAAPVHIRQPRLLNDCLGAVGIDPTSVDSHSTPHLQRASVNLPSHNPSALPGPYVRLPSPRARLPPMSPSAHLLFQSPRALIAMPDPLVHQNSRSARTATQSARYMLMVHSNILTLQSEQLQLLFLLLDSLEQPPVSFLEHRPQGPLRWKYRYFC